MMNGIKFNHPPFVYYPNMWVEQSSRADSSREHIFALMAAKQFRQVDRYLLYALGRYGYLNAFLLLKYLHIEGFSTSDNALVKERLSFLLKNGFIKRYEMFHKNEETAAVEGSPFIYSLSGGGWRFLRIVFKMRLTANGLDKKRFLPMAKIQLQDDIANLLCVMAENQFSILFDLQFQNSSTVFHSEIYGETYRLCGQRLFYHMNLNCEQELYLFPFAVRQYGNWQIAFVEKLKTLKKYTAAQGLHGYSALVICESSEHAIACEEIKYAENEIMNMDVFYASDYSIASNESLFDRLIEVRRTEDGHLQRSYFRLNT